ncbi:hypothetical protein [Geodermatophilus saharensis]|uniref:hypothetical protein n=1 Tax=Geodermatophilus saharensis TaxID=1137994 RepID=UPI000B771881|nr:hypothetical protein [Geodermatophilus saharensis]
MTGTIGSSVRAWPASTPPPPPASGRLLAARSEGRRDRRLTGTVERAAHGERASQWRQPGTAR